MRGTGRKLVLDEEFTYGMVAKAYHAGFANPYNENLVEHPYTQTVLQSGSRFDISSKVLGLALLYEEIYLEPFDNFFLEDLQHNEIYPQRKSDIPITIMESKPRYISSNEVTKYLEVVPIEGIADIVVQILRKRKDLIIDRTKLITTVKEDIPKHMDAIREAYFEGLVLPNRRRNQGVESKYKYYSRISKAYLDVARLLEYAEEQMAHLKLSVDIDPYELKRKEIDALPQQEHLESLLAIVFNNLTWVKPRSYDQYLKLLDNKHIKDFRDYFFSAYDNLIKGETNLNKIEQQISKASKEVKQIHDIQRVDGILFWLSLPIEIIKLIASSTYGIPGIPGLGLLFAAPKIYTSVQKWRYRWALPSIS